MIKYIITIFFIVASTTIFSQKPNIQIVVKLNQSSKNIKDVIEKMVKKKLIPVFHHHYKKQKLGSPTRLSNIFTITAANKEEASLLLAFLRKNTDVVYAEKKQPVWLFETTNDPYTASQYYLEQINAYEAWDVTQGDSSIVIGIVDTGTDFTHPDLAGKCAVNYEDPINGVDDDMDGFVDNYHGWDMGENNNNPQADINGHGVRVAGIAAAATNNEVGIAGVGYNVKYLPVKTMNSLGELNTGWEGIIYAADHGADVIVCSWGGIIPTNFGRDVVRYATYDKNCVVVAAGGNSGNEDVYYPASFPEVLSVAATNQNDQKWAGSTFGYTIDISAPGQSIYSTTLGGGYSNGWGTSFAAPAAGAVAALVKHARPHLSAMQIISQIKNTTFLLDTIAQNIYYEHKLGSGRLDAFAALTDTLISGVEIQVLKVSGGFNAGDTLNLIANATNYLMSAAVMLEVKSLSNYAEIITDPLNLGILETNQTYSITNGMISIKLANDIPYNHSISLMFTINDGVKTRKRFYTFNVNKSYTDITFNNLNATITSNGRIGYNETEAPLQGNSFWLDNCNKMAWECGIIYGTGTEQIISTFLGATSLETQLPVDTFLLNDNELQLSSIMTDANKNHSMGLKIQQIVTANTSVENTLIFQWKIINTTSNTYNNFHFGVFFDWDLESNYNKMYFDNKTQVAICKNNIENNMTCGVKIVDRAFHHYAFDLIDEPEGINISDGFTDEERWFALSNERNEAGGSIGNDVAHIVGTNAFDLWAFDTVDIFMIVSAGFHESNVISYINNAVNFLSQSNGIKTPISSQLKISPQPANHELYITSNIAIKEINIFDINGKRVISRNSNASKVKINIQNLKSGIYIIKTNHWDNSSCVSKFVIKH